MSLITIDELPDFLQKEYPESDFTCIADIANESIVIQKDGKVVSRYPEAAFEGEKVTEEAIRASVAKFLGKK